MSDVCESVSANFVGGVLRSRAHGRGCELGHARGLATRGFRVADFGLVQSDLGR